MKAHGPIRLAMFIAGLLILPAVAFADAGDARHPGPGAIPPPPGVPQSYVFTHSGWFHPSCVVRVRSDEVVGADLVVRGRDDGAAHFSFSRCAYSRFDLHGNAMAGGGAPAHVSPQAAAAVYDGYIVYYEYDGAITAGSTLVTDEIVPPAPTNVANQDIAFFNDILTSLDDILQPVLDFNGETRGKWSIESEHCCLSGNDMQSTIMVVAPGDEIQGTVTGTGCGTNGVCSAWAVTTLDVTSGKSTTLNTTAPNGVPNGVSPGSLETYGVMSCDMFPAGGETTFTDNTVTAPDGTVQALKYRLNSFAENGVNAEVPTNCGYGAKSSGNDFTLIYGTVPAGADAGTSTGGTGGGGGGASGAGGTGGAGGHAGTGGTGGHAGAGGAAGHGGASGKGGTSGTSGSTGTGGVTGTGGISGTGGAQTGGISGGTGGASGTGGTTGTGGGSGGSTGGATGTGGQTSGLAGAGDTSDGSTSSGCSCDTSGNPTPSGILLFAFVIGALLARSRQRPSCSRMEHGLDFPTEPRWASTSGGSASKGPASTARDPMRLGRLSGRS